MNFFPRHGLFLTLIRALLVLAVISASTLRSAEIVHSSTVQTRISALERAIPNLDPGELLLSELNCAACHQASAAVQARLASKKAPILGRTGLNLTPQFIRAFLSDPYRTKPGTTMPDLLHGIPPPEKDRVVDSLVQFLISVSPAPVSHSMGSDPFLIDQGRFLYHSVGCVACHAPQESASRLHPKTIATEERPQEILAQLDAQSIPMADLPAKFTVEELARFLVDPLRFRPSGRMPSLKLTEREATAIAMYLLRSQAAQPPLGVAPKKIQGLAYQYFEAPFNENTIFDALQPKSSGTIDHFAITPRQRSENVGLRFSGIISVPRDGEYTFYTASDDGSRLYIDAHLVVRNDGMHSTTERSGKIPLKTGDHSILVTWFNGGGPAELKVSFQGPGLHKQEIPPAALSHLGAPMIPLRPEQFAPDAEKARVGRDNFIALGCAACHSIYVDPAIPLAPIQAKALDELQPNAPGSCISIHPNPKLPQYFLSDAQRDALLQILAMPAKLAQPLSPSDQVIHTMAALNCYACHSRNNVGGPTTDRLPFFTTDGDVDMGDEGRVPPHLNETGAKLRAAWLRDVLVNKATVRPYMITRMPQFGADNVAPLLAAFPKADAREHAQADPADATSLAKYGRRLVGTDGLSCISCHTFAGHKSLGIPAIDLTVMTKRLNFDWFHRYLLDPQALRPGTRMPSFWPEGKSANQQILQGNSAQQIEAIWAYLRLSDKAGLPLGLIQGRMELVATNEAIVYRNFIAGVHPRAIGVGYPEKANLAFDAEDLNLSLVWQGPFIDAARHRTGRGEGFEPPLGFDVMKLPAGPPFAMLANPDAPWPNSPSRAIGYRMRGYLLDHERRPKFLYSYQNIDIEDYPVAVAGELEPFFRRVFALRSPAPVPNLYFRAALSPSIEMNNGSYVIDQRLTLRFKLPRQAQPILRQHAGQKELLVPVLFNGDTAEFVEEIIW